MLYKIKRKTRKSVQLISKVKNIFYEGLESIYKYFFESILVLNTIYK